MANKRIHELTADTTPDADAYLVLDKSTYATPVKTTVAQLFQNFALDGFNVARAHSVYCFGDSLTAAGTYPTELATQLGAGWSVINKGTGGDTADMLTQRLTEDILNAGDAEYVVVLAGINDVIQGTAAAAIETDLQTIYTAIAATGCKVVACTITPFKTNTNWSSGKQTVLDTVNTWILSTATDVDYAIDTYDALEDGTSDTLAAAYDGGDHLHLSTAGYNLLADTIYAGAVWTASTGRITVTAHTDIGLNQSLLSTDDVTFDVVTAGGGLVGPRWQPLTGGDLLLANSAGTTVATFDTAGKAYRFDGALTAFANGAGASIAEYSCSNTAYFYPLLYFNRSRGTVWTAPSVVSANDYLGGIAFNGYATGYQQAAIITVFADTVAAATVDGNMRLIVSRAGADIAALDINANGGLIVNQGGDATMDFRVEGDTDQFLIYVDASDNAVSLGGAATSKVGFYGVAPIAQAVLATGTGKTVDNVITALQNLGLVKQA